MAQKVTEKQALGKLCRHSSNINPTGKCCASNCMAWAWAGAESEGSHRRGFCAADEPVKRVTVVFEKANWPFCGI